mmetsp:Transcript_89221/g.252391  ORF Transcript_89221/g.252391 Transcript_89221/m.252391 type:complete len:521 (-) Transcript_89221:1717-3279(-)
MPRSEPSQGPPGRYPEAQLQCELVRAPAAGRPARGRALRGHPGVLAGGAEVGPAGAQPAQPQGGHQPPRAREGHRHQDALPCSERDPHREAAERVAVACHEHGPERPTPLLPDPGPSRHGKDHNGLVDHRGVVEDEQGPRARLRLQQPRLRQHRGADARSGGQGAKDGPLPREGALLPRDAPPGDRQEEERQRRAEGGPQERRRCMRHLHRRRHGPAEQPGLPVHRHRRGGSGHRARGDLAARQGGCAGGHGRGPVPAARHGAQPGGAGPRPGRVHVRPPSVDGDGVHASDPPVQNAPGDQRLSVMALLQGRAEECSDRRRATTARRGALPLESGVPARRRHRGPRRFLQEELRGGRVCGVGGEHADERRHGPGRHRRDLAVRGASLRDPPQPAAVCQDRDSGLHRGRVPGQREGGDHLEPGARQQERGSWLHVRLAAAERGFDTSKAPLCGPLQRADVVEGGQRPHSRLDRLPSYRSGGRARLPRRLADAPARGDRGGSQEIERRVQQEQPDARQARTC